MQVVAKTTSGTVVVNCTIAVCITLSMVVIFFITKTIRSTIGTKRAITVRRAFSIERVLVAIPINFTIRITRTMPIVLTRFIGPWSWVWVSWLNLNETALDCETGKNNDKFSKHGSPLSYLYIIARGVDEVKQKS